MTLSVIFWYQQISFGVRRRSEEAVFTLRVYVCVCVCVCVEGGGGLGGRWYGRAVTVAEATANRPNTDLGRRERGGGGGGGGLDAANAQLPS